MALKFPSRGGVDVRLRRTDGVDSVCSKTNSIATVTFNHPAFQAPLHRRGILNTQLCRLLTWFSNSPPVEGWTSALGGRTGWLRYVLKQILLLRLPLTTPPFRHPYTGGEFQPLRRGGLPWSGILYTKPWNITL